MELCQIRAAFTASVLLTALLVKNSSSVCRFEYTLQPPFKTIADCNPYSLNGRNVYRITTALDCSVSRQTGVTDQFDIRWFRENTTGAVEDLGPGVPEIRSPGGGVLTSLYHETEFNNQQYNPSFLGKYWCQVINTTPDPDQPLMRSNVFTLLAPENYTGSTCFSSSPIQSVSEKLCADLPAQSDQTTLPHSATIIVTSASQMTTTMVSKQQSPSTISKPQSLSSISKQQSPSSVSTNSDTLTSSTVVAVTVLVVLVVSVTVITMITVLVCKRCSRKQTTGQVSSCTKNDKEIETLQTKDLESALKDPQYCNPHYFHSASSPSSLDSDAQKNSNKPANYQPLHTNNRDYVRVYSTTNAAGMRQAPSVEVGGKLYSIVDQTRKEEHVYTELHQKKCHHCSVSSSTQKQEVHKVLQYYNPHYFHHHHPTSPPPSGYEEAQQLSTNPVHYQPLHTNTRDYISVYNTTTATGKRTPTVELESKVYSIVDSTKREIHVYSTPQ